MLSYVLWSLTSFVAYIGGIFIIVRSTPRLILRSYDEGLFMGIAALDIFGAILAFGAFVITFALFNGSVIVKLLDFLLLVGIVIVGLRMASMSLRPRLVSQSFRASRIIAGVFCLGLVLISVYCIILLFLPSTQ